jgi:predicted N-acetyltransferase YhbS
VGVSVVIEGPTQVGDVVRTLLDELPEWFGIEQANADYVRLAQRSPGFVALMDARGVGALVLDRVAPDPRQQAVEVAVLAVAPDLHRMGIGGRLMDAAETFARSAGAAMTYVKTLGPSDADPYYAQTRAFYAARGYVPIEEFTGVWPDNPCLVMAKPL